MSQDLYVDGGYLKRHPTWHVEDAAWKARNVLRVLARNGVQPKTICDLGCGAGAVLDHLQQQMPSDCRFDGVDVSPQVIALCAPRANERLTFHVGDIQGDDSAHYDLLLLLDVLEHVEDCRGLLRRTRPRATHKVLHMPLDLSVQSVLRATPIRHVHDSVGHIHYFTKESALDTLRDTGYEIVDWLYTATALDLPTKSLLSALARLPRRLSYAIHRDWAVRILGGYSLMVLAR